MPVKVGYDMTVVPHDDNGLMDWLLDYTQRTRLGNYVVFRNFGLDPVRPDQWQRWGEYCRDHGIWVSCCTEFLEGTLAKASGEMLHDMGMHEFPGKVYATVIPRNIRLAEAPSHGIPVTAYDRSSRGAIAYKAMAEEIRSKL